MNGGAGTTEGAGPTDERPPGALPGQTYMRDMTMARNISRDYATMDEDERRRFAQLPNEGEAPEELDLEEPRDESGQGHSQIDQEREAADPEHRDGMAAELDDARHEKRARRKHK